MLVASGFGGAGVLPHVPAALAQSAETLSDRKTQAEIDKIREEFKQLAAQNQSRDTLFGKMTAIAAVVGGLLGSVITVAIGVLGYLIPKKLDLAHAEKMRHERELASERHDLELFRDLASASERLQLAAAAVLLQRVSTLPSSGPGGAERKTIVDVLVAVTKERIEEGREDSRPASPALVKYVADNLVKAMGAVLEKGKEPVGEYSRLALADWQGAQLADAWWERVDARRIDFYQANFRKAGLGGAVLRHTGFYKAKLCEAVLRNADLSDANLQGADLTGANLRGANLSRARLVGTDLTGAILQGTILDGILFDATTKWPAGFQPVAAAAPPTA